MGLLGDEGGRDIETSDIFDLEKLLDKFLRDGTIELDLERELGVVWTVTGGQD